MKMFAALMRFAACLTRETSATILIMFALLAPILIGAAGMSLDYAQAFLVRQRLMQALDAAALAAAASSSEGDVIEQKVKDFFNANYPEEKVGFTFEPEVNIVGDEVFVTGQARYNTLFLKIIGVDHIDVEAQTAVKREIKGLEVVMVLDNTGSMSTNNNIQALKNGTTSFINILYDAADNANGQDSVRIGMVPYSNSVRLANYGQGKKPDNSTYADGDVIVTLPSGVSYSTNRSSSSSWYGCVVEHKASGYSSSATHVSGSSGQLWRSGSNWSGHGWNAASTTNDPYDYDTLDNYEGPWDIYMFGKIISSGQTCGSGEYSSSRCSNCTGTNSSCASTYCFCRSSSPNQGCPHAMIMPMTSDKTALLAHVNTMSTDGNTLGNIGMAWGARLLSPEPPFEEAHPWDDENWKKAIVMMTDGDNTENGTYSSYWVTAKNNMTVTKFNDRFAETCEALKEKGVIIYTVTFTSGINSATKNYYKNCATSEDHYFDAPTQSELTDAFERIARELGNLHITQ